MRRASAVVLIVGICCCVGELMAQSTSASITGLVTDPSKAVIVGAKVTAINDGTNVRYRSTTNSSGSYDITNLPPGMYRVEVEQTGFKGILKPNVVLHVQDTIELNFEMAVGSASETVTVEGGAPLVNTESAAVSTVVDRQFAENIPLNGRSFQTLIALTPGVVLTQATFNEPGQFSVNGQRADANYFTVDGASANVGISTGAGLGQSAGGALPGFSAVGGTNSLVSVDAMQEFRVQTSSFAPEFGRSPGGQVSIVTRSGTNALHGSVFDYLRNDVLDADNWFNGFTNNPPLPKAKERQNDFGGVLGGPVLRNRTFFFFSYEGLRLRQPLTNITAVPSATSRQAAVAAIKPFFNLFPVANGADLGNGFAQFAANYSNPISLDAASIRIDHPVNSRLTLFGRYNYSPSKSAQRGPFSVLSTVNTTTVTLHTLTLGATEAITARLNNEIRLNYSNTRAGGIQRLDNFGGATPLADSSLPFPAGVSTTNGSLDYNFQGAGDVVVGKNTINDQRQVNVIDNVSLAIEKHQLKLGVDYRWLSPITSQGPYHQVATFSSLTGPTGAINGVASSLLVSQFQSVSLLARNVSLYAQDTWRATPRLTLTYGLRWDHNPPIKGKNSASEPFTVTGLNNPATASLAPRGTSLYASDFGNIAPRIGASYVIYDSPAWTTVLRGGFGIFYDVGMGSLGAFTNGFPFQAQGSASNATFPLSAQQIAAPPLTVNPPVVGIFMADPNLTLPKTLQWNVALEQSLGSNQVLSMTYVGAAGRDLLRQDVLLSVNANISQVFVTRNSATSDYDALQVQFRRRLSRGLQAVGSYTWSHSLDIASNDSGFLNVPSSTSTAAVDRGNSDFDIRRSFTGALTYDIPAPTSTGAAHAILGGWSVDSFLSARSAPPVNLTGRITLANGALFSARPNVVPGMPFYLFGSQFPGGKALNPAAFTAAPGGTQGNFGRNALRSFGAWQVDFALRRRFRITERVALQFGAEFFNVFNHPNFGNPSVTTIGRPLFGQSTQMLASSLAGLSPIYQIGGPRSGQLMLKVQF